MSYDLTEEEERIAKDRQKVYGDPKLNHELIAQCWSGLLQPWAKSIAEGKPLPPHVIALCMCGVKLMRQRICYHEDNYVDMSVYQKFAKTWQKEWDENETT